MGPQPTIRSITREELRPSAAMGGRRRLEPGPRGCGAVPCRRSERLPDGVPEGQPVGCISVVRYGASGSSVSTSSGPSTASAASACVCGGPAWPLDGCVVGLDGVVAQQANYARSGFALAHRNVRYAGRPMTETAAPSARVKPVDAGLTEAVAAYDRRHFPADRARFLDAWLDPKSRKPSLLDGNLLRGYAVLRACAKASRSARSSPIRKASRRTCSGRPSRRRPGLRSRSTCLSRMRRRPISRQASGLRRSSRRPRMYKGPAPDLPLAEIYGLTTLELG